MKGSEPGGKSPWSLERYGKLVVDEKGELMVRYYGHCSNVSRGMRKKQNQDEWWTVLILKMKFVKKRVLINNM